ncbi:DUF2207 domain-containing protein [Brevibacillus sp. B_LB10_24]|uniref:DUF2207 domain-containing protein n=1 Tax=Brevibacillus sp. B_LB10_24 TaxID=3380645 RepID=UPI0038BAE96B
MTFFQKIVAGLTSLLFLFLPGAPVHASERSFDITDVVIHARIDQNGDMLVTEQDTYWFNGDFNGILVLLDSSGSDGIENFQAFEAGPQQEIPLTFETTGKGEQIEYKVYDQAHDETKVFKFTYTFKNVVKLYEDTAELYWKFFDDSNPSRLGSVRIEIELPGGVGQEEILAFGHGPLSGSVEIPADGVVRYQVSPLQAEQMLEARVLFPKEYVPDSSKIENTPMLDNIRQQEVKWAEDADKQREAEKNRPWRLLYYAIALFVANLAVIVILFIKYDKEYRPAWSGKYCRELPEDVTPAVVSCLMDYNIQSKDLMATLIDLVRKKYVDMQVVKKDGGLFRKEKYDYRFTLIDEQTDGLKQHEAYLIDWLFRQLGKNNEVSLLDIRDYTKKKANARTFVNRLSEWENMVVQEATRKDYFDSSKTGRNIAIGIALAQIAVLVFFAPDTVKWLLICAFPLFFYGFKIKRRTRSGATERAKWKAFRRFLQDYSQMASREPLAVHLWEHYLVYAISLGAAKKVIAIANTDLVRPDLQQHAVYSAVTDGGLHQHFDHFADSFDRTVSAAKSNLPSSRGSGGGFSSGGGGGGGGGGRGAF